MIRHEVIGLIYTRRCPLACRHCITESSPSTTGKMRLSQAKRYLTTITRYTKWVSLTGGEPLLFHREILELTAYARRLDLSVAVVTGAGWVKDEQTTHLKVSELAQAGVARLTISSDAYHEEFAARERAILLARLAVAAGLEVRCNVVVPGGTRSDVYRSGFSGIPVEWQPIRLIRLGKAAALPAEQFEWTGELPKGRCEAVLKALIDYDGIVYACCGPSLHSAKNSPLVLGDAAAEPLEEILERAIHDPILEVISLLGPYGLYHLLQEHPSDRELLRPRSEYAGICELCLDLTNSTDVITSIRNRLRDHDAKVLLAAARMWSANRKPAAV